MQEQITDSQFHMWRAIFAMAHADDVVTNEEIRFMVEALEDVPFSDEQRRVLTDDIAEPQDIEEMFVQIENPNDQAAFFTFARKMVWADGDYGKDERDIILKLQKLSVQNTNIDELVGHVELELESDDSWLGVKDIKDAVMSFRDRFLAKLHKD